VEGVSEDVSLPQFLIRPASAGDATRVREIYAPHIEGSFVSFETVVPTAEEMAARIADFSRYGWLVYEVDGQVLGYAYASPHRARAAYQWCCEVSAYLAPEARGQGVGTALYRELFARLRARGLVNAYAGITLPNAASVGFHESLGFKLVGVYEKIGYKLGAWHDVGWWALRLGEGTGEQPRLSS
jgi:phosphinothricin acetyltransferase